MFYKMITEKRDTWLDSPDCTVNEILRYIENRNKMRDAQIEAIKTYLFLKIACNNRPLYSLFASGAMTLINSADLEITSATKAMFDSTPAALALYEYSRLTNDLGEQVSDKLEECIKKGEEEINYSQVFKDFFDVDYPDYLFSLPMGAGKTIMIPEIKTDKQALIS